MDSLDITSWIAAPINYSHKVFIALVPWDLFYKYFTVICPWQNIQKMFFKLIFTKMKTFFSLKTNCFLWCWTIEKYRKETGPVFTKLLAIFLLSFLRKMWQSLLRYPPLIFLLSRFPMEKRILDTNAGKQLS